MSLLVVVCSPRRDHYSCDFTESAGARTGARPTRTIIGDLYDADKVNETAAPVQNHVLGGLGLAYLARHDGAAV
jgi:hypothetical protein